MFRNIGGKIKVFVMVVTMLGFIACIVYGGIIIAYSVVGEKLLPFLAIVGLDKSVVGIAGTDGGIIGIIAGSAVVIIGSFVIWLLAFIPYGLGQLIQNTDKMVKSLDSIKSTLEFVHTNHADNSSYGEYPYAVYTDEYGRPYYPVPEDMFCNEEQVKDGDLVPSTPDSENNAPEKNAMQTQETSEQITQPVSEQKGTSANQHTEEILNHGKEKDSKTEMHNEHEQNNSPKSEPEVHEPEAFESDSEQQTKG